MKVCFLHSDKPRERLLADAFLAGVRQHGHETAAFPLGDQEPEPGAYDVVCMVGVKSRERFKAQHRAGAHIVYLDKGYSRHKNPGPLAGWEYWRVAIDAHQPTAGLAGQLSPTDRFNATGHGLLPWRTSNASDPVVIAGSSLKYHEFYGLPHPTTYAKELVRQLRALTARPLVYRPKPTWREATAVRKAAFSRPPESLGELLATAHVVITHGSNACYEAAIAGVPAIVLGDGVARPISSTSLDAVEQPMKVGDAVRLQWAANLAYWQYSLAEMADGSAWSFLGGRIHG